jgi:hypothetical protein
MTALSFVSHYSDRFFMKTRKFWLISVSCLGILGASAQEQKTATPPIPDECWTDLQNFCPGLQRGAEVPPLCLLNVAGKVSPSCQRALSVAYPDLHWSKSVTSGGEDGPNK